MSGSDQGGAGRREVAWRVFAAEYDDADFDYSESDEERAPNYVVTPTGARVNRLFVVGVLTEVEQVGDDVLRGRVVDPTGAFVLYAGQYQPDEMAFLENADPPTFVAVTGKARTFQPEDSDRVFTSIRPESINAVDADTRDRWVVQTAEQTLARVSTFADAIDSGNRGDDLRAALEAVGVDAGLAAGVPLALDHYGTTKAYLAGVRGLALDSARVVAGELSADDVGPLDLAPDEGENETVDVPFDYAPSGAETGDLAETAGVESGPAGATDPEAAAGADAEAESESAGETSTESETTAGDDLGEAPTSTVDESETASETGAASEAESGVASETEAEAASDTETSAAPETEAEVEAAEPSAVEDTAGESSTSRSTDHGSVEDAEDAAELQEEIGTEEPPTVESEEATSTDEAFESETGGEDEGPDIGTAGAGDEMYEFDEEERQEVEEEYGLEFSSGSEVDSPEESDLEPPETDVEGEPGDADQHAEPTADDIDTDELQEVESAAGGTEAVVNDADEAPAGGDTAAVEAPGASIGEDQATAEGESEDETAEAEADESGGEKETPEDLEDAVMDEMAALDEGDGVERETLMAAVVQEYDVTPADVEDALEAALMAGRCYESGEDTLKPI